MSNINDKTIIEKLPLESADIIEPKLNEVIKLFPEIKTEGNKIDFEKLKSILSPSIDTNKERFNFSWPGKGNCYKVIQAPSTGTLRPLIDESLNFSSTENVIIEGDNLEVLKLLQKSYLNRVKMVFIDPPYNTGNDFVYPDDYSENLQTYLEYTGQIDSGGKRFGSNLDTDGRFHSKWLNMMYPRLYLARNLLRDDGLIFITIDDKELANLRKIMDEIFGEENFVALIAWEKRYTRSNNAKLFYSLKDSILVYRKTDLVSMLREARTSKSDSNYKNPDNDPRGPWATASYVNPATKEKRPNLVYEIKAPDGRLISHPTHAWKYSREEHLKHVEENRLHWAKDGEAQYPRLKLFLSEADGLVPIDIWHHQQSGTTDEGGNQLKELFDGQTPFDNPKPTQLIKRMLSLATNAESEDIILDFFAGSGTTAQAVLEANSSDGGNRNFILVQLPEPTGKDDFKSISDITKERVRRFITKLSSEDNSTSTSSELGFRVFKLDSSNFKLWDSLAETPISNQLELHVDHVKHDRMADDILYEILLKSGFPLTTKVEIQNYGKQTVYSIAGGMLLVCLEDNLTLDLIKYIAEQNPERVVCLDQGFANNDQLKTNAVQIFKTKGIASFKTV